MTLDFMRETGMGSELPARFRCAVVGFIGEVEKAALKIGGQQDILDLEKEEELKRRFDLADYTLDKLIKIHPTYFRQFMGREYPEEGWEAPFLNSTGSARVAPFSRNAARFFVKIHRPFPVGFCFF